MVNNSMVERKKAEKKIAENRQYREKPTDRDERGYFAKGNQIGRMKKRGYTLNDLIKAMRQYEKEKGLSFLEIYLDKVTKDNRLMDSLMNRFIAQKNETNLTGGLNLNIEVNKKYPDGKDD